MKKRLFAFLLILVLVAGLVPVVSAQDEDAAKLNCLNLSKDDCTIVQTSHDNLANIKSFSPSFSVTEDFSGVEAIMSAFGAAGATGAGAAGMMPSMASASSASIQGSGAVVIDPAVVKSDKPYNGVAVSFTISGSSTSAGKTEPMNASFVLADGVAYWQDNGKWQGVAVEDIVKNLQENGGNISIMGMPISSDMMSGMMGTKPADGAANADLGGMNLLALLDIPDFLKQERLADADMMGQTMNVFAFSGDVSVLLKAPEVQKALGDMMTGMMSGGAGGTEASGAAGMMALYVPVLLDSTTGTATVTRWIGADDQFIHQVSFDVDATIDLNGGATGPKVTPLPPITLKVNVTLTLDKINDTAAPGAPTGATMVDPADLFPAAEPTPA